MALRIAVIDDHILFRQGLKLLLQSDSTLKVVAEASEASQAYPLIAEHQPDLVVLDLTLPGCSGITIIRELSRRQPPPKVLVLTMHASEEYAVQALSAGANGYALKTQDVEQVSLAIREVAEGKTYLAPTLSPSILEEARQRQVGDRSVEGRMGRLSPREREVFDMIIQSYTNREIAKRLFISVKTVETHRANINRKLGVHSAAELIRYAGLHGMLHQ
jgi:DNA-binding NarL/FixJ family response regulator